MNVKNLEGKFTHLLDQATCGLRKIRDYIRLYQKMLPIHAIDRRISPLPRPTTKTATEQPPSFRNPDDYHVAQFPRVPRQHKCRYSPHRLLTVLLYSFAGCYNVKIGTCGVICLTVRLFIVRRLWASSLDSATQGPDHHFNYYTIPALPISLIDILKCMCHSSIYSQSLEREMEDRYIFGYVYKYLYIHTFTYTFIYLYICISYIYLLHIKCKTT